MILCSQELGAFLDGQAVEVEKVGLKGDSLLQKIHDSSPDHAVITGKVADVGQTYAELQKKLKSQEAVLANKIKDTDYFNAKVDELESCIQDTREKLSSVGPVSTDPALVQKYLSLTQVCISRQGPRFTLIKIGGYLFVSS